MKESWNPDQFRPRAAPSLVEGAESPSEEWPRRRAVGPVETVRVEARRRRPVLTWEDRPGGRSGPERVGQSRDLPGPEAGGGVFAVLLRPRGSPPARLALEPLLLEA